MKKFNKFHNKWTTKTISYCKGKLIKKYSEEKNEAYKRFYKKYAQVPRGIIQHCTSILTYNKQLRKEIKFTGKGSWIIFQHIFGVI